MISSSSILASLLVVLPAAAISGGSGAAPRTQAGASRVAGFEVVRSYPHDPQAFTQGLVYLDGVLYEGTGLNGRSSLRKVRLENGEVLQLQKLEERYFGEGIAVVGPAIVQLTWQSGVGFVYDRNTFQRTRTFNYQGEGWGLTYDGTRLVMSDGTATLRFLDPTTLKETGRLLVRDGARPVEKLNELEIVKGEIFANIWGSDRIARISPKTGAVTGWINLAGLLDPRDAAGTDVLNGIAYDAAKDRLFVTGKLWPKLFEIRLK
jgi:glutamine cyclotransferase